MTDQPLPSINANDVQGFCPACGHGVLVLGEGGHVTCTLMDCPNPSAADEVLRHAHLTECEHAAGQRQAEAAIARIRAYADDAIQAGDTGPGVHIGQLLLHLLDQPTPDVAATQATERVKHSGPNTEFCVLCLSGEHERVDQEQPVAEPFFEVGKVYEPKGGDRWEIRFQREGIAHFEPVRVDCDSAGLPLAYGKLSLDGDHVWTTMDRFAFGAWKAADRPVTEAADA